ncbi:MAG: AAA family ATPase [Prevotellaceae bacterium]|jgi:cellulose biosynthesis protein BcsQ|nr:AAA family ATPase [Prevotellaceae bacterium]
MRYTLKHKPSFISIATQKGGAGKTTLTALVASMAHYAYGYSVAVIDCDEHQYSFSRMRARDEKIVYASEGLRRIASDQFLVHHKACYPVIGAKVADAYDLAAGLRQADGSRYDLLFFDVQGSVGTTGWISLLASMDYVFLPFVPDMLNIESTEKTMLMLKDLVDSGKSEATLSAFWNMVNVRERRDMVEVGNGVIRACGVRVLRTALPMLSRFRDKLTDLATAKSGVFTCTLLSPTNNMLKDSCIDILCEEIFEIMQA